jgi:hypothetical protein
VPDNGTDILCLECGKRLAEFNATIRSHVPSQMRLITRGAVPVPEFGWLCSQVCALAYEARTGIKLPRGADGQISCY